ncbi:two-component system histidine kinase PnpS [Paenibacillus sp. Marseille-Q4541]|uniref:two-component system histidine kinase PnpS n=1 Tax=Paenibacillus sp. Marseille-Q4541 TaxID=2831522 RepID=UPI001BA96BB7|nr:ATP-binding protein [Paenibacillus sp. Marseille-Q4541]
MKTFRFRLTAIMMTLIFISVLTAGIALGQVFKDLHIKALEENMVREINLLQSTFSFKDTADEQKTVIEYYTEKAKELEELTDSRTTFILRDGTVIGDSEYNAEEMDNHLGREEIMSITEGTNSYGQSIRTSDTLDQEMLYIALPVTSADGAFDGYIRLSMSLKTVDEGLGRGWLLMIFTLLVLFIVVAFVCYRVGKSLTGPIEHVTKVANQISKLDYDARVRFIRDDEIGQLGIAINGMADSLQAQLKMIRDSEDLVQSVMSNMTGGIIMIDATQNIAVLNKESERMLGIEQHRVTGRPYLELKRHYELTKIIEASIEHRDRVQEEVRIYNPEELIVRIDGVPMNENDGSYRGMLFLLQDITAIRRLENMRSEFVANVSHELKTPVAAVKGFAETLLSGGVKDEETMRSFLQIIYDEGDRLNRLIGDILELSKIESKRSNLECSPVHLHSFFEMVTGTLGNAAHKKQIRLLVDVPEELFIEADEDKLKQIFLNLISNGINYTLEGGQVKIQASMISEEEGDEQILFHISDTGIGIPKADLPRVFERFYRVDKGRSRNSGGTGLGLSIVKHLVELHHGTLMVESELGTGTTFTVALPLLQDHSDEE